MFGATAVSKKIQNNTTFLSSVLSLVNNCAILNSTAKKFIYNTYLQNTVESRKSMNIKDEIKALKEQKNAVILAHYYVADEIQEIADYVGDSFALSKTAATLPNPIIVYCGVSFMGESGCLLSPEKKVLMPDASADCPMAHMVTKAEVDAAREFGGCLLHQFYSGNQILV